MKTPKHPTRKPTTKQRRPTGRPTLYREEYPEQAYKLCLLSATDAELADFFEVTQETIYEWQRRHPKFSDSIARGKMHADANVAERLYKRALGYSHEAVKIFMPAGAAEPVYAPYTEHYPPDTQAASLWLRNRQSAKWRDKVEHAVSMKRDVHEMTTDELVAFLAAAGVGEVIEPADDDETVH